jgi:mono/diheme cytochrome c family protein
MARTPDRGTSPLFAAAAIAAGLALHAPAASAAPDGAQIFAHDCQTCHKAQGQGVPGAFPALAGDKLVKGDPSAVAHLLLHGKGGMPNFSAELSDAEIAAVITYVRGAWGNNASPVDAATVAAARSASAGPAAASVLPYH